MDYNFRQTFAFSIHGLLALPTYYAEQGLRNARAYVRLSIPYHHSTVAAACGGFAAERPCGTLTRISRIHVTRGRNKLLCLARPAAARWVISAAV